MPASTLQISFILKGKKKKKKIDPVLMSNGIVFL